jgi:hypothetical protein
VRRAGAETFLDEADLDHGDDFDDEIVKASKRCTELLVLLTLWAVDRPRQHDHRNEGCRRNQENTAT